MRLWPVLLPCVLSLSRLSRSSVMGGVKLYGYVYIYIALIHCAVYMCICEHAPTDHVMITLCVGCRT